MRKIYIRIITITAGLTALTVSTVLAQSFFVGSPSNAGQAQPVSNQMPADFQNQVNDVAKSTQQMQQQYMNQLMTTNPPQQPAQQPSQQTTQQTNTSNPATNYPTQTPETTPPSMPPPEATVTPPEAATPSAEEGSNPSAVVPPGAQPQQAGQGQVYTGFGNGGATTAPKSAKPAGSSGGWNINY